MTQQPVLTGGVDEAGRGCVLGPLVVAGVSVSRRSESMLRDLGVRDSKKLSPKRRETLYSEILKVCERVNWAEIGPGQIDEVVTNGKKYHKLNHLEAVYFAKVIDELGARRVTVDASDTVPERFGGAIAANLARPCSVVAVHKADRDFPVVSAASIVAKVHRDRQVERLRKVHGDFGSGYPSDPSTRIFFIERMRKGAPLPEYVRKSWKTWARLEQKMSAAI
ncbi:MAG: ribonuclease HII [Thaumarchaeota archaeon]|nr:ribonuclease HII [Nitrososphaerota archaeon]